ncbi:MAG: hypothetical protein R3B45_09925 [Bdellovibrionota bacterium]
MLRLIFTTLILIPFSNAAGFTREQNTHDEKSQHSSMLTTDDQINIDSSTLAIEEIYMIKSQYRNQNYNFANLYYPSQTSNCLLFILPGFSEPAALYREFVSDYRQKVGNDACSVVIVDHINQGLSDRTSPPKKNYAAQMDNWSQAAGDFARAIQCFYQIETPNCFESKRPVKHKTLPHIYMMANSAGGGIATYGLIYQGRALSATNQQSFDPRFSAFSKVEKIVLTSPLFDYSDREKSILERSLRYMGQSINAVRCRIIDCARRIYKEPKSDSLEKIYFEAKTDELERANKGELKLTHSLTRLKKRWQLFGTEVKGTPFKMFTLTFTYSWALATKYGSAYIRENYETLNQLPNLNKIEIYSVDNDTFVDSMTHRYICARLEKCSLVRLGDEYYHGIIHESDAPRNRVLDSIFLNLHPRENKDR